MIKEGFVVVLVLFLLISLTDVSAISIDDEFKKLANYAGEYETGNINYVQLLIYTSSIRGKMNEVLGATGREIGGVLKQEQIKKILGEPIEDTKWVWSEGEEKEIKLDNAVPVWKKIVFDGRKIQIRLNAWPSIFSKREFKENGENEKLEDLEGKLIYRLNFEIEFKKPEEQLNIQGKIDNIKSLAQTFNSDSSSENAEALAKESVNAERTFESYFRQSGGKCEDIMSSIFGTENKRQTQQLLVQEISFCEGENFEVIARLEMCDECEWNWINLDFWFERRGPGPKEEGKMEPPSPDKFKNMEFGEFEEEVGKIIDEIKQACVNEDFNSIISAKSKLWALNEAWNQKSNNVWEEIDKQFNVDNKKQERVIEGDKDQNQAVVESTEEKSDTNNEIAEDIITGNLITGKAINEINNENKESQDPYYWIKQEQEKRQKVKELSKSNYEARKQFYLNLFSGYDKKEYSFAQIEFQKRLIEEFKERGEEICDNNKDDNKNEAIDCADEQCGGKICGKGKNNVQEGNETKEMEVDFYCIEKECKAREEIQEVVRNVSMICPEIPSIECSEGSKVFFSRYDNETNCPIETSCLEETESCKVNEDCKQPACGIAECIENKCKVTGLTECRELECVDGDEKICEVDGKIVEICSNGFWEKTGDCEKESEIRDEIIVGNECLSANDCGSDNVCNNGVCQMLPQVIITKPAEEIPSEENKEEQEVKEQIPSEPEPNSESEIKETAPEPTSESQKPESETTGNIIFNFIGTLFSKMRSTGAAIIGFDVEEAQNSQTIIPSNEEAKPGINEGDVGENIINNGERDIINRDGESVNTKGEFEENKNQEREEDRNQEGERRQEENKERCKQECKRPCVEKCIRGECGEELNCVVDEVQKKCEGTCESGDDCIEKCIRGGDWWKEFENKDEHKEEKGVFQVGGNCRTSQGKTEGFIWFGGWGEPFEQIQPLKNKYYSGGQADWCKYDFENLKKQRQEFEKSFNQEFVAWFFEKYLANSAENWEQSVSGIFELYWKDVDNSREMAYRMQCLGIDELSNINLINVKYDTEYGSVEFWEEIKTVKLPGMDKEVQVISPYMKAWVFPPKEFMIFEMKQSMKNHEFPGSPEEKMERKNEEGFTSQEKQEIRGDKGEMEKIQKLSQKYGGNFDALIQFKDFETGEIVFNFYAQINEEDLINIKPMLPEEAPSEDAKVEIDFKQIYEMIYSMEKEMRGAQIESPPWDKKFQPVQKVKEVVSGVKMWFKLRSIINSAKYYPADSEEDIKPFLKMFFMTMGGPGGGPENKEELGEDNIKDIENDVLESKEKITGEIIL